MVTRPFTPPRTPSRHPARRSALAAALMLVGLAACAPQPIADQNYEVVFEDQFTGTSLGPAWAKAWHGGALQPVVGGGTMTVRTTAANSYYWGYVGSTGARTMTEPSYPSMRAWQEGYFEARVRYTDNPWAWPAFWLYAAGATEAWPRGVCHVPTAEWDIMENGIGNAGGTRPASEYYVTVIHRNTIDGSVSPPCGTTDETRVFQQRLGDVDLSQWHTWGGRWEGNELCTYIDDIEIQCMAAYASTAQPMHLVFTMQYLRVCADCGPRPAALELEVDWVRVWQR